MFFLVLAGASAACAQEYNLTEESTDNGGNYLVKVTVVLDKNQAKEANDWIKRVAVDGVMFRGVAAGNGGQGHKALIKNPTVKTTKAEFFRVFENDRLYANYANIRNGSVVSTKLAKKKTEYTALVSVDKEALVRLLEESGVVKGMGNLW